MVPVTVIILPLYVILLTPFPETIGVYGEKLNCKSNIRGGNYAGDVRSTQHGITCQRWDSQNPNRHDVKDAMMIDGSLSAAENFCRSPDFDPGGPWCFTTDPEIKWDYCNVPTCNETGCVDSPDGAGYIGAESRTVTGYSCTFWSDVVVFSAYGWLYLDSVRFPDGKLNHNLCRNPLTAKDGLWCYSSNPSADWEFCDVSLCERQYDENQVAVLPTRLCEQQGGTCIQRHCCRDNYYVSQLCGDEDIVCCVSKEDCRWQEEEALTWPSGSYALPSPVFGCPDDSVEDWGRQLISLTASPQDQMSFAWSDVFHLAGPYSRWAVTLQLCERQDRLAPPSKTRWPAGQYCMYRAGSQPCPTGFSAIDYVIDLGESTAFSSIGWNRTCDLDENTMCLSICCRGDGRSDTIIQLPTTAPFILLKSGKKCQQVAGVESLDEQLSVKLGQDASYTYNGRPRADLPLTFINRTLTFNFCYYESNAFETCWNPMDRGLWYRGFVNLTSQGPCSSWRNISKIDHYKHYHHVGLDDNNYCRNTLLFNFEDRPWCYVGGQKVHCGIPECDESHFENVAVIGPGRAARQQYGDTVEAQLVVDGDLLTCSSQSQIQAWWQLDLQGVYSVVAISIFRQNVDLCVLRFINIHVGMTADDFKESGSLLCARNVTVGSMEDAIIRCVQPVTGQHVTIDNLVYLESETYTEKYEKCFVMCEVKVFVRDTFCGRRLLEQTVANQIQPYMKDNTGRQEYAHIYSLHSHIAWCIMDSDVAPTLLVNLLIPRRIQSIVMQGNVEGDAMVTEFHIKYGFSEAAMIYYEEYPGIPKLFKNDAEMVGPQYHRLLVDITASLIRVEVVASLSAPCLRLDFLGCITEYDNLVSPEVVAQSSNTLDGPTRYSTDNDVTSCSTTFSEDGATWSLDLKEDIRVHTVVMETGLRFAWNLAGGKETDAISQAWSGFAWRANDGRVEATNYWQGSCSHTYLHEDPWWAVDLGHGYNVTTVVVTNRDDCCYNRLDEFYVLVGNNIPAEGQQVNMSDFRLCAHHNRYFGAGDSHTVRCESPLVGRYVVVMLDAEEYLTVCELQAFGHRDPFLIWIGRTSTPDWSELGSLCQAQNVVGLGESTHVFNCAGTPPGRHMVSSVRGLGPMSVCTALVYGGLLATIRTRSSGVNEFAEISCHGRTALQLWWASGSGNVSRVSGDVSVARSDLTSVAALCEGRAICRVPVPPPGADDILPVAATCSFTRTREEKCNVMMRSEALIQTPNFPYYYGVDLRCQWTINAPMESFVVLNTSVFHLAGPVESIKDGCLEFNLGVCEDEAKVGYAEESVDIPVETAALFISSSNYLVLRFKSCFRQVSTVRDGFYGIEANVAFEECGGCSTQRPVRSAICGGPCGHIVSYGYPSMYQPNERMEWTIVVEADKYILLTFVGFNIYEHVLKKCERDYVLVYDVDLVGERTSTKRFCNSNPPHNTLVSSWYQMLIHFITDADEGATGFHAVYQQQTYQPTEEIPFLESHTDCPDGWLWFASSCYNLEISAEPLSWQDAEDRCRTIGPRGHLVSIASHLEMTFLHFMLSTKWRSNDMRSFIGLTDSTEEGNWRWSDGSPITYTAWSPSSDYSNLQQPDGAEVEDCAMIRLDSIHSTDSWHDIPCAYDQVRQYLCELDTGILEVRNQTTIGNLDRLMKPTLNTVLCQNGELILAYLWCDGTVHCRDGSDEQNCSKAENGCTEENFICDDGTCVSMSVFCDFKQDCPDRSDELLCVKPNCTSEEYRCDNGECIPSDKRCDMLIDCQDKSDETFCVRCSTEVSFQCFDGTCISINKRCDGVVDCPGALHEDESEDCVKAAIRDSCRDWKLEGVTDNGNYPINPQNQGVFEVECDMTSDPSHVITILHHDSETRMYVTGYPNPGSYIHPITYAATINQIKAMKKEVDRCEQYVRLECYGAAGTTDDFWENINGVRVPWVIPTESACKCSLSAACQANRSRCWCEDSETSVPRLIVVDGGELTAFADLPMTAISLSGTSFKDQQYQYHTVGPLVCYQGGNASRDEIRCGSGQFTDKRHRCMYDVTARGDVIGCRDAAHLEECSTYECPENFFKCPDSFCIPLRMLCDSSLDCLNGEDEVDCEAFSCPGMYKCWNEAFCIETTQRCDGERHCPYGDDELLCEVTCPQECSCAGYAFFCSDIGLMEFPLELPGSLRKLDFTGNLLRQVRQGNLSRFYSLGELLLGENQINTLEPYTFVYLSNLYKLDLSRNVLQVLQRNTFYGLANLRILDLSGNKYLREIKAGAFLGLSFLPVLNLNDLSLQTTEEDSFIGMPSLRKLDLSENNLGTLPNKQFQGLERLLSLNVSLNPNLFMVKTSLDDLQHLQFLQSDSFKYCCFVSDRIPEENCLPERDELSSCQDLMRRDVLKAFLWILGLMALIFNGFVLVWRLREKFSVYSFSVFNLAAADLFMGVYMVTLAVVDLYYRGVYIEYAEEWTHSWLCQVLGFLNTLSSEASVFMLCLISGDRFYNIVFPFKAMSSGKGGLGKVKYVMAAVWFAAFSLAVIPLFPLEYFKGGYYSRSGMCISIYLTNEKTPGWQFSVFIFHGLNFFSFMFIFMSYAYMYRVVVASSRSSTGKAKASESEIKLAQRMTLVVATDFLCWVPINIMGAAALGGMKIPGEVYAWVVVFLLPVNSAINPLLYTISAISMMKKSKAKKGAGPSTISMQSSQLYYVHSSESSRTLKEFLGSQAQLSVPMAWRLLKAISQVVVDAHSQQRVIGSLDANTVIVMADEKNLNVGLQIVPQGQTAQLSMEEDVACLGKVFASVLRRCAKAV